MLTGTHWPPAVKITVGSILGLLAIGLLIVFRAMIAPTVVACLVVSSATSGEGWSPRSAAQHRGRSSSMCAHWAVLCCGSSWGRDPGVSGGVAVRSGCAAAQIILTVPWMESISLPLVATSNFLSRRSDHPSTRRYDRNRERPGQPDTYLDTPDLRLLSISSDRPQFWMRQGLEPAQGGLCPRHPRSLAIRGDRTGQRAGSHLDGLPAGAGAPGPGRGLHGLHGPGYRRGAECPGPGRHRRGARVPADCGAHRQWCGWGHGGAHLRFQLVGHAPPVVRGPGGRPVYRDWTGREHLLHSAFHWPAGPPAPGRDLYGHHLRCAPVWCDRRAAGGTDVCQFRPDRALHLEQAVGPARSAAHH